MIWILHIKLKCNDAYQIRSMYILFTIKRSHLIECKHMCIKLYFYIDISSSCNCDAQWKRRDIQLIFVLVTSYITCTWISWCHTLIIGDGKNSLRSLSAICISSEYGPKQFYARQVCSWLIVVVSMVIFRHITFSTSKAALIISGWTGTGTTCYVKPNSLHT